MNIVIVFATMFLLMFLGLDIFVSMGVAAAVYLLVTGAAPLSLITQSMVNLVLEEARKGGARRVTSISLVLGELSGVVGDCVELFVQAARAGA